MYERYNRANHRPDDRPARRPPRRARTAAARAPASPAAMTATPPAKGDVEPRTRWRDPGGAPLEVVIFKGGYGDDYAVDAEAVHRSSPRRPWTTRASRASARCCSRGSSPTARRTSSTTAAPVAWTWPRWSPPGKLKDLTELLDAPSLDDPGKKVKRAPSPAGCGRGRHVRRRPAGAQLHLHRWGIWYSKSLFGEQGLDVPEDRDEMIALSDEIKAAGHRAWTYQGKYRST